MFGQESQGSITDLPNKEPLVWKRWDVFHTELFRECFSMVVEDDKMIIVGGRSVNSNLIHKDLILVDPKTQTLKIIKSHIKDEYSHGWIGISACYWKDNKIIVHGGDGGGYSTRIKISSTVAIVTLKDLDSKNPSALWEKVETQTQLPRVLHSTYIYNDKMYAFGGVDQDTDIQIQEIWCLDLNTFAWSQIEFEDWQKPSLEEGDRETPTFHENKAYIIPTHLFSENQDLTIQEFDLDLRTCKQIKVPKTSMTDTDFRLCPQIINGGLYICTTSQEDGKLWFHDLENVDSKQWIPIEMKQSPDSSDHFDQLRWCNNQLVSFGSERFWSLPLPNLSKKKKQSPISAHITNAQKVIKDFLIEAPYSDISFEVESKIIPAHKWWLCQKSKYFANMFSSGMSEAQASKIKITDMKASTFQAFLEFLYSEHVELDNVLALELLQQADKYSINQLKKECEKYLSQNIDPENYVIVGQTAELLDVVSLRDAVVTFIAKNIKTLRQRKDFNDISDALLRESLVKFIVK